ncbi:hypothetical protein RRG08_061182 [Elysia crispata]|uniref:Uncharacterized protein n=1 Tax=Elysia crispata TaxID=231223 RepID=A0AAE1DIU9_9GAST|nr:hypothetical protein RRG08_061182 [Elysia crispata]
MLGNATEKRHDAIILEKKRQRPYNSEWLNTAANLEPVKLMCACDEKSPQTTNCSRYSLRLFIPKKLRSSVVSVKIRPIHITQRFIVLALMMTSSPLDLADECVQQSGLKNVLQRHFSRYRTRDCLGLTQAVRLSPSSLIVALNISKILDLVLI